MNKIVDLSPYKKDEERIFTNRDNGVRARKELRLEELEKEEGCIEVLLPNELWSINPSFFGGIFESSIKEFKDTFWEKYVFLFVNRDKLTDELKDNIEYDFDYVLNHMES